MSRLYEIQKSMRAKRRAALQRGVIAILDIGTTKITCMVLQFDPVVQMRASEGLGAVANHGSFRVIGVAKTQSRGVRLGEITNMEEAERAIRTAVQGAQKMANTRVDHVLVCFSGARPRSYGLTGRTEVATGTVANQDIGNVLAACDLPPIGDGREVIHAMPVNFALDQNPSLNDPRGQIGHLLSVDMHLLTVDQAQLQNMILALSLIHI